jgi:hypothetical protein
MGLFDRFASQQNKDESKQLDVHAYRENFIA